MAIIPMCWGEMTCFDSGNSGQPLLFLHGTGCDSSDWASVIERLPCEQRCITLDFRGHGQSTVPTQPFTLADLADDVGHLRDYLGFQGFVIVGHSLGGMGRNDLTKQQLRIPPNPNIQWVWVPNSGHYLPHECPTEVAEACVRCLE